MSVKPILFNTEMVQAILSGRKTTTRRPIKPTSKDAGRVSALIDERTGSIIGVANCHKDGSLISDVKPPYQKGDILYVRETWSKSSFGYIYRTDNLQMITDNDEELEDVKWHPSIHMPKEAARIWLKVTNVRVERVEGITEDQAHAEGFYRGWQHPDLPNSTPSETARQAFMWVWHKLYGIMNDYVWVIEFNRIEKPEELI